MAVAFEAFDEEKERERLRRMTDEELIREGRSAIHVRAGNEFRQTSARGLRHRVATRERGVASASSETINHGS